VENLSISIEELRAILSAVEFGGSVPLNSGAVVTVTFPAVGAIGGQEAPAVASEPAPAVEAAEVAPGDENGAAPETGVVTGAPELGMPELTVHTDGI
jgi:hypothetical protein